MSDPRHDSLAKVLISHSTKLKAGERVLIDVSETPEEFVITLIRAARAAKAEPFVVIHSNRVSRELALGITGPQAETMAAIDLARLKKVQAYIAVRGSQNISEMADVPQEKSALLSSKLRPALDYRINKTRWVVLRWPTRNEGAEVPHGSHGPGSTQGPRHRSALQHQGNRFRHLRRRA